MNYKKEKKIVKYGVIVSGAYDVARVTGYDHLTGGTGYGTQSDVWGVTAMPWFNITDKLQVVARYNYIESDEARGVRLARYDSFVTGQRGDEYHEIYGGLNYFVCGHRLKVQTGLSYVSLDDSALPNAEYHGFQWTTGLRLSF